MSRMRRNVYYAAVALACLAVWLMLGSFVVEGWRGPTRKLWAQVAVGDTAESVIQRLGEPFRTVSRSEGNEDYYLKAYGYKRRPISNRVLIYTKSDLVLYVWLDADDRVEETFIAGS